jgi:hypothetical protein
MTERKPAGLSFTSWIDEQISRATEQGAFDDLPGAGKPLPPRTDFDGLTWVREYVAREGGSPEDCLPTPLKLRKESERLAGTVQELRSEQLVRDAVAELNQQILDWRRLPLGPPVFVPLIDVEAMVGQWHAAHPVAEPAQVAEKAPAPKARLRRSWLRRPPSGTG